VHTTRDKASDSSKEAIFSFVVLPLLSIFDEPEKGFAALSATRDTLLVLLVERSQFPT